ncbi:MAG: PAS domain S-box protein, partial [Chloroflexi bacterium]|nr:PAS domain S-box protein [Chloroflexota bacterium]
FAFFRWDFEIFAHLGLFGFSAIVISELSAGQKRHERVHAQLAAETRYRALLEAAPDAVVVTDAAGRMQFVNSQTERLFGYARYELLGQPVEVLLPEPEGLAALAVGKGREREGRRKDGGAVPVEVSISTVAERGEAFTTAVIRDVRERRQAEEEQRHSAARLASAVQAAGLGSWEFDVVRQHFTGSEALCRMLGAAPGQLDGPLTILLGFIHPDDRPRLQQAAAAAPKDGAAADLELRIIRADRQERILHAVGEAITDHSGRTVRIMGAAQDITERKVAEERARQLLREQAARSAAEAAARRARFLAEASAALGGSLDEDTLLHDLARLAVATMADWCIAYIAEDGKGLRREVVTHARSMPSEAVDLFERLDLTEAALPSLYSVMRTGRPVFIPEFTERHLIQEAAGPGHLRLSPAVGIRSLIIVPVQARGKTLGVMVFLAARGSSRFTPEDLALAQELAHHTGLALDNARLYHSEQRARQAAEQAAVRTERLQAVTAALAGAISPEQAAQVMLEQGRGALGADGGALALLDERAGVVEVVYRRGDVPTVLERAVRRFGLRYPLEKAMPLTEVARTGAAIWVTAPEEMAARYPGLAKGAASSAYRAWAIVPLLAQGRTIGALSLSFTTAQTFDEADRAFVLTLAGQCAQALERTRLFAAEQRARAAAEEERRRLTTVLHQIPEAVTIMDAAGTVLLMNPAALELTALRLRGQQRDDGAADVPGASWALLEELWEARMLRPDGSTA